LRTQALARDLDLSPEQVELTSSHTGLGIEELATSLATAAGGHS
jgi:hypothetical protein